MASIFTTDLGELYNQWGERVAYNEGFQKRKIDSARSAGADAFDFGVDKGLGLDAYFSVRSALVDDAASFQVSDSAVSLDANSDIEIVAVSDFSFSDDEWSDVQEKFADGKSDFSFSDDEWSEVQEKLADVTLELFDNAENVYDPLYQSSEERGFMSESEQESYVGNWI